MWTRRDKCSLFSNLSSNISTMVSRQDTTASTGIPPGSQSVFPFIFLCEIHASGDYTLLHSINEPENRPFPPFVFCQMRELRMKEARQWRSPEIPARICYLCFVVWLSQQQSINPGDEFPYQHECFCPHNLLHTLIPIFSGQWCQPKFDANCSTNNASLSISIFRWEVWYWKIRWNNLCEVLVNIRDSY